MYSKLILFEEISSEPGFTFSESSAPSCRSPSWEATGEVVVDGFLIKQATQFKNCNNLSELHGPSLLLAGDNESQEVNGVLWWLLPALRCRQQALVLADPSPRLSKPSFRSSALFPLPVDVHSGSLSLESCSEENDLIPNSREVRGGRDSSPL